MPLSKWLLMVVVLASIPETESITSAEKTSIEKGLEAGKEILNVLADKKFTETLTKIGSSIGPYLGALGPAVGVLLAFIPTGDSAELAYMKEMMENIDNRFNQLDNRFDDVVRRIDWIKVAVNFGQIEQKIAAMKDEYSQLYASSAPASDKTYLFVMAYENDFQNSGLKLYQTIVDTQGVFQETLGDSVMRYTENDRNQTQEFLLGVMRLLMNAVKIELGYYTVKKFTLILEERTKLWEDRIIEVKDKFDQIDVIVKNRYLDQSEKDTRGLAAQNARLSNNDFLNKLANMLETKYYWRDWGVLVYNDIAGEDKHYVSNCGGFYLHAQAGGRNIVVSSKDKASSRLSQQVMLARLNAFKNYIYSLDGWFWVDYRHARKIWERIDKTGACGVWVIKYGERGYYKKSGRVARINFIDWYNLLMFS